MSNAINTSSAYKFCENTVKQIGCVIVAGCLRRSRFLPTPAFVAFSVLQGVLSNAILEGIKFAERKVGLIKNNDADDRIIEIANYVLSQALSIGLTYLAVNSIALAGFALLYDMNLPSLSKYDAGSIFCIVAQATLCNLFVTSTAYLYGLYKQKDSSHQVI